jgi:enamine deaminase RidA (YjgF/YER057c/UK114 family)
MSTTNRRKFLGRGAVAAAAATAAAVPGKAQEKPTKRVIYRAGRSAPPAGSKPRMSSTVALGNLLFISGVGYHQQGDIKVHTKAVLDSIKAQLEAAGTAM